MKRNGRRQPSASSKIKKKWGFTLIEILIVVFLIGLLAMLAVFAYQNTRTKGKAAAIASSLKSIERGLQAYALAGNRTQWWNDDAFQSGEDPGITEIVNEFPEAASYLGDVSRYFDGYTIRYDNDGDVGEAAGQPCVQEIEITMGVSLFIAIANADLRAEIDRIIDSAPGEYCGKLRSIHDSYIYYRLGTDSSDFPL